MLLRPRAVEDVRHLPVRHADDVWQEADGLVVVAVGWGHRVHSHVLNVIPMLNPMNTQMMACPQASTDMLTSPATCIPTTHAPSSYLHIMSRVLNGNSLEGDLDVFHARLQGWYVHRKAPPGPAHGKKPVDYLLVSPTGRVVMFEAKSTKGSRWSVHLLDAHQFADLAALSRVGTAGVYLRTSEGDAWLPWSVVAPAWTRWYKAPKKGRAAVYLTVEDGVAVRSMDWTGCV